MKKISKWKIFKPSRYNQSPKVKVEFVDFMKWYLTYQSGLDHDPAPPDSVSEEIFDNYCKENDIILVGELRKFHGANTRNAKAELCLALLAFVGALILAAITCHYFKI